MKSQGGFPTTELSRDLRRTQAGELRGGTSGALLLSRTKLIKKMDSILSPTSLFTALHINI